MGGSSPVLASLVYEIWQWCLQRKIYLSTQHIPGFLDYAADQESRVDRDSSDWKLDPTVFACLNSLWGSPRDGLVCNPTHKSITKVCELETRPGGRSNRRLLSGLVSDKGLCIPPIQSSGSVSVPTEGAEYPATVSDNTGMENTTLVPPATGNEHRLSADVTNRPNDSQQGRVATPPALLSVSRVVCLSQRYSSWEFQSKLETFSSLPGVTRPPTPTS